MTTHNRNTRKLTPKQELLDLISQEDLEKQRLLTTDKGRLWSFIYHQPVPVRRRLAQSVPYIAARYAIEIRKKWWPELEDFIFTDIHAAYHYQSQLRTRNRGWYHDTASDDIKERCSKAFSTSVKYAPKWINNGQAKYPWLEGEAALRRTPEGIFAYLRSYIAENTEAGPHTFPKELLLKLAEYTSDPEFDINQTSWADSRLVFNFVSTYYPQGFAPLEPFLLHGARFHNNYVDGVIRSRWPLLEQWVEDNDKRLRKSVVQDYANILIRWDIHIPRAIEDYLNSRN